MVTLSYIVLGFLFGALVFGSLLVWQKRRTDAHLFESLNETRRTDRAARLAIAEAQRKVHLNMRRALGRDHRRMLRSAQAQLADALTGYDMACASIEAHEDTIAKQEQTIAALRRDAQTLSDRVDVLTPRAQKRQTWKQNRRAERRIMSGMVRDVADVTERDQKIAGLQAEAFDTSARLAAVTEALDGARSLAEVAAKDAAHLLEHDEDPALEYARQSFEEIAGL